MCFFRTTALLSLLIVVALVTSSCASVAPIGSDWLAAHNKYRCMHGIAPLSWSTNLAQVAEWRANNCSLCAHCKCQGANCEPQYAKAYAENATCYPATAQQAVANWYGEVSNYNYANPKWSAVDPKTGHFINVIANVATNVGCFCSGQPNQHCYCDYDSLFNASDPNVLSTVVLPPVNTEQFCQTATYTAATGWAQSQ